jgi:hypothetical protein
MINIWSIWFIIEPYFPWLGMILGILGALVIWQTSYRSKIIGFELWFLGNMCWVVYSWDKNVVPLLILNAIYAASNVAGIWKNMPCADSEKKLKQDLLQIPKKL